MQEVVFVHVGDPRSDLAGHFLQLQEFSVSVQPIMLRHVTLQITLHNKTQTCVKSTGNVQ